jgi:phenylpropionate dioxygenase-like ring-hydroxylating dioxygenase large terminal subunit
MTTESITARPAKDQATSRKMTPLDISRRHIANFSAGTTDTHPDGPRFIPAAEYLDRDIFENEKAMLRQVPLVVAHGSQLPAPGTYHTEELMGVPILLVRQNGGAVQAFLNSCSHRGAKLVEGSGPAKSRFVCPYHAWTYARTGELVSINQPKKFGDLDKACHGLTEIPCAERYGLIFVTLDQTGITDVDSFLGDFAPHLAAARLDEYSFARRSLEPQQMNWKIAMSTYYESYHVKMIHSGTVGPLFVGNLSTHDSYGPDSQHHVTTWGQQNVPELAELDEKELERQVEQAAPFSTVLYLFPNVVITHSEMDLAPLVHLIRITPGSDVSEQLTDFRILKRNNITPEADAAFDDMAKMTLYALEEEDYSTAVHILKGMQSGLQPGIFFGANEITLTEIHRGWARATGRSIPDMPAR